MFYTEFLGLSVFVGPRWVCDGYVGGHKTENLIDVFKANAWCDWDWGDIQTPNTVDYISYAVLKYGKQLNFQFLAVTRHFN